MNKFEILETLSISYSVQYTTLMAKSLQKT